MQRPVTAMATDAMVPENKKAWQGEETMADGSQHSCQKQLCFTAELGTNFSVNQLFFLNYLKLPMFPIH